MIGSVERYSSSVRKRRMSLLGTRTFRILLIAFILYVVVSRFIVATYRVESVSIGAPDKPGRQGDCQSPGIRTARALFFMPGSPGSLSPNG